MNKVFLTRHKQHHVKSYKLQPFIYGALISELLTLFSKNAVLLMLFSFAVSDLQYSLPNRHFYEEIFRSGCTFFGPVLSLRCVKYIFVTDANIHIFFILSGRYFPALAVP